VVMFVAPTIEVPVHGGSEVMKQKQDEMQRALERVRDAAESWFALTEKQKDKVRSEWSESGTARAVAAELPKT
jgi:hypothetical protein